MDESTGRLLVQGIDQKEANEFANLLLSNVKTCNELEVDRNFCFQVSATVGYIVGQQSEDAGQNNNIQINYSRENLSFIVNRIVVVQYSLLVFFRWLNSYQSSPYNVTSCLSINS